MRKVGFGVIGCGVISTAYLTAAKSFPHLELRGVADMRSEAARKKGEATNDAVAPTGGRPRQAEPAAAAADSPT